MNPRLDGGPEEEKKRKKDTVLFGFDILQGKLCVLSRVFREMAFDKVRVAAGRKSHFRGFKPHRQLSLNYTDDTSRQNILKY